MIEAIAIGVFVFVAVYVGGVRAIDTLTAHKAKGEADRLARMKARITRTEYTGALYNAHGREIDQ